MLHTMDQISDLDYTEIAFFRIIEFVQISHLFGNNRNAKKEIGNQKEKVAEEKTNV